jgi:hypothetical protein
MKKTSLNIDTQFVSVAVNSLLGMLGEKQFGDVFKTVVTSKDGQNEDYKLSLHKVSTATYSVLLSLFQGDHDLVKEVGAMIASTVEYGIE